MWYFVYLGSRIQIANDQNEEDYYIQHTYSEVPGYIGVGKGSEYVQDKDKVDEDNKLLE